MKNAIIVALAVAAVASPLVAADLQIELDPEQTSVAFRLKATMHTVHGTANATAGSLRLDSESGDVIGTVTIDASSADTGNKKRDKKMHGKVLRSGEHPAIVFRPRRFEGELDFEGQSDITLSGEIEILGQPQPIALPLSIEFNEGRFTAIGEFEVPYVEWGVEDPSTFVLRVAKEVQVSVKAVGTISTTD